LSAAKHTPGPWVINDQVDMLFIEADGAPVASVEVGEGPEEAEGAEADARLIAAAPDLLAELEDVLSAIQDDGEIDADSVRASIAKARGGV
jgi:hypothetical protein